MSEVLIVGGGIMGLWAALLAGRAGIETRLLERKSIGAGASGGLLGALMPHMPDAGTPRSSSNSMPWFPSRMRLPGLKRRPDFRPAIAARAGSCRSAGGTSVKLRSVTSRTPSDTGLRAAGVSTGTSVMPDLTGGQQRIRHPSGSSTRRWRHAWRRETCWRRCGRHLFSFPMSGSKRGPRSPRSNRDAAGWRSPTGAS